MDHKRSGESERIFKLRAFVIDVENLAILLDGLKDLARDINLNIPEIIKIVIRSKINERFSIGILVEKRVEKVVNVLVVSHKHIGRKKLVLVDGVGIEIFSFVSFLVRTFRL